ncbi:MAG: hypothetical protein U0M06_11240 [Clostridia bacterium]|nr:hypothetical protein [Clostridia bacterium]
MAFYKFADRIFELRNKYSYTEKLCENYSVPNQTPNYVIEVNEEEIMAEKINDASSYSLPYLESLAIYRKIAENLAFEDCFLMHAAVIEYEGSAYAFAAKSGTGKTTHISLWQKAFGDKVRIVNGDKPLVRRVFRNGACEFIVYGTPWCGKERQNENISVPLRAICILCRSEENSIEDAGEEAVPLLLQQMLVKKDKKYLDALMSFIDSIVTNLPIYCLGVNMDISAAFTARDGITAVGGK